MPTLVNSSPFDFAQGRQFIVHGNAATVNHEPITVNRRPWRRGFTLIELLVVITIIAILISAVSASFTNAQMKSRDGRRKSDLKSVQQALEVYIQANGKYPSASNYNIQCNIGGDSSIKEWGQEFICGGITYAQQLPKDPVYQATTGYKYFSNAPNLTYILLAHFENENDSDLDNQPAPCLPPPSDYTYCVINP